MPANKGSTVYQITWGDKSWTGIGMNVMRTPRIHIAAPGEPSEWLSIVLLIHGPADIPPDGLSLYEHGTGIVGPEGGWQHRNSTPLGGGSSWMVELNTMPPVHTG
jgi:hypothetical protein